MLKCAAHRLITSFAFLILAAAGGAYGQQSFPNKPIRIFTGSAGGGADLAVRLIAQVMSSDWGQPVIVENRSAFVSTDSVVRAQPDGHTLLLVGSTPWVRPLFQKANYDPVRDLSPVTLVSRQPNILVVHPSVPAKSVKELIALARAQPGKLNYASTNIGTSTHLAAELFNSMARVNIVRIPYKGTGPAMNDLLAGRAQLMFAPMSSAIAHITSGKLRALGVTSAAPFPLLPDLPTVAASGLTGYEQENVNAMLTTAKTPEAIIARLNQEVVSVLNRSDIKKKLLSSGVEVVGSSPKELAAKIQFEMEQVRKVIKDAGIKIER